MRQPDVVRVTGASSGFGNRTARAMAEAGHLVHAGLRATASRHASAAARSEFFRRIGIAELLTSHAGL